ncbi:hypothetical protein J2T57_003649 [Natronocella acetinitrilica]|uniref:DUF945 family protein n=1 Tax=Natronocella acetinitrilica TaxID=414046 RepID=A0AAE3KDM5_9GAMM|nr:DUF945 family protein [Natronocella acetinitrilica]MCP1676488.1 hypothetical protein [Natronocella acetinitrilica]
MKKGLLIGMVGAPLALFTLYLGAMHWSGQRVEAELRETLAALDGVAGVELRDIAIDRSLRQTRVWLRVLPGGPLDVIHRQELEDAGLPPSPLEYEATLSIDHGPVMLQGSGPGFGLAAGLVEVTQPAHHLLRKYGDHHPEPGRGIFRVDFSGDVIGDYTQPAFEGTAWTRLDHDDRADDLPYDLWTDTDHVRYRYALSDGQLEVAGTLGETWLEWEHGVRAGIGSGDFEAGGVLRPERHRLDYSINLAEFHYRDNAMDSEQVLRGIALNGSTAGNGGYLDEFVLYGSIDEWDNALAADRLTGRSMRIRAEVDREADGAWFADLDLAMGPTLMVLGDAGDEPLGVDGATLGLRLLEGHDGVTVAMEMTAAGELGGEPFSHAAALSLEGLERDAYGAAWLELEPALRADADSAILVDILSRHFDALFAGQPALLIGPVRIDVLGNVLDIVARFPVQPDWIAEFGSPGLFWPQAGLRGRLDMDPGFTVILARLAATQMEGSPLFVQNALQQQLDGFLRSMADIGLIAEVDGRYRLDWRVEDDRLLVNQGLDVTEEYQMLLYQLPGRF